jgi:hypothetical protein
MSEYTVLVEAGTADGAEWQALAPPETTVGDSAVCWLAEQPLTRTWPKGAGGSGFGTEATLTPGADPAAGVYGNTL